jgi:hypothetical protein
MLAFLQKHWQLAAVLFAIALSFSAGYWTHRPQTITKTITQTIEKIVEKRVAVVDHSTITTTTDKKPSGETVTTVIEKKNVDTTSRTDSDTKSTTKEQDKSVMTVQANYSIGALAKFDFGNVMSPSYEVSVGHRLIWGLWVQAAYDIGNKQPGIGLRLDF